MTEEINFTIIIPHYNSVKELDKLLKTIPERNDLQVIVVDDCSTEGLDYLEELKKQNQHFLWLQTDCNGGAGKARNKGLEHAKGRFIMFADADDLYEEGLNEILSQYTHSDYDIIYFNARIKNFNGEFSNNPRLSKVNQVFQQYDLQENPNDIKFKITQVWPKIFSSEFIKNNQITFEETAIFNDVYFSTLSDFYAKKIKIDFRNLYIQNKRIGSVSHSPSISTAMTKHRIMCWRSNFLKEIKMDSPEEDDYFLRNMNYIFDNAKWKDLYEFFRLSSKWGLKKNYILKYYLINRKTFFYNRTNSRINNIKFIKNFIDYHKYLRHKVRTTRKEARKLWNKIKRSFNEPLKLDIHAVEHCNLNCGGCSHFSPVAQKEFCNLKVLEKSLKKLSKFKKHFFAIQILGGEPLLNPDLSDLLITVRKYFENKRITLITNGLLFLNPKKLPKDFWQTCRENNIIIKLSRYPIDIDFSEIEKAIINEGVEYELFADRSEGERGWNEILLYRNGSPCRALKYPPLKLLRCTMYNCFQLVGDRIYACSQSAYVRHLNKAFNLDFKISRKDYIKVDNLKTIYSLRKLLIFSTPFCKYCAGTYTKVPWRLSEKNQEEWVRM